MEETEPVTFTKKSLLWHDAVIILASIIPALIILILIQVANLRKVSEARARAVSAQEQVQLHTKEAERLVLQLSTQSALLASVSGQLDTVLHEDQRLRNDALEKEVAAIQKTYAEVGSVYEDYLNIRTLIKNPTPLDKQFGRTMKLLSERNYDDAQKTFEELKTSLAKEQQTRAAAAIAADVKESNTAPTSGYSRQKVQVDGTFFQVDIVAGDLTTNKLIVDTASESDCHDNCPVLSLADYVARNGAFAGVNGNYFCPTSYPSCAGKTNSFDTLIMNKSKTLFNKDNNLYSTVPGIVFREGGTSIVGQTLSWDKNTGADGYIANFPALLSGGNIAGSASDPKQMTKGPRVFVGSKGSIGYLGLVRSATVNEAAKVLQTLGLENALNLDSGGSTALWVSGGYKAGPGRAIPNAVLFVRR